EPCPRWNAFVAACGRTRALLQQARGGVAAPPALRTKARYMNLEPLIAWTQRIADLDRRPDLARRLAAQRGGSVEQAQAWWDETLGWTRDFAADLAGWAQLMQIATATRR